RLSAPARDAVLAAAGLASPTPSLIAAALGRESDAPLAEAEDAGVLEVTGRRIAFTHPLLAAAAYTSASRQKRRTIHRSLAAAVTEPEEQARHLALATEGPDEAVAARLEAAAAEANARGAPEVAAELGELACELTPAHLPEARRARVFALAEFVFVAGDTDRAQSLLAEVLAEEIPGPVSARALELRARILHVAGTAAEAAEACARALELARDDVEVLARIHATM